MAEFRMPSLGADMDAGTLVEWRRHPGERVARGDIIAVVETQKGAIEIEVFQDGVIETIEVPVGQKVPVGTVLARIRGAEELAAAPTPPSRPLPTPGETPEIPPAVTAERARISPRARRRAESLGVDLAAIAGTGPGGAVSFEDVERAARARSPAADMRKAIAAAMSRSKREIPHYYLEASYDVSALLDWVAERNAGRAPPERLLAMAPLLKVVALALRQMPVLNGFWRDGAFLPSDEIHLGVAISLRGGGLVAPALHHPDRMDAEQLMRNLSDLVARARRGGLRSSELSDSTATVTSLGESIADTIFPVIYPPQVAIVGMGGIVQRAWVVDGRIEPRQVLRISLAADHRASNGIQGARFLEIMGRLLQEPGKL
ncbi:MAG: 2-oxo acid dehydrogenase subunit E2 [Alphaproteobacteria bacterium]|nr:2-oxo acid dehydrogenase subunit E2 [Alphaproteobacteria bacterium]